MWTDLLFDDLAPPLPDPEGGDTGALAPARRPLCPVGEDAVGGTGLEASVGGVQPDGTDPPSPTSHLNVVIGGNQATVVGL